ncbi:MAG: PAS domain S-box protein [Prolixibacteraceae bacterium]|jgi:PAS domain S-box-containing protein
MSVGWRIFDGGLFKMTEANNSRATIMGYRSEELLKRHPQETPLRLSETETMKLIQKLEESQLKIIELNNKLRLAKEQTQIVLKKYTELYDLTPFGYFILSQKGEIIELNRKGENMLGRERINLKNNNFSSFITEDSKELFDIFLRKIFSSQTYENCELILCPHNNRPIHVHLSGYTVKGTQQCLVTVVNINRLRQIEDTLLKSEERFRVLTQSSNDAFIQDIAERKQAEKQLNLLSRAIERSPVTVVITDEEGNIEYTNPKFTEVTGYTLEEVKGQNPRILQSGEQSNEFYNELWKTILSGNDWHGEFKNRKKNGDIYWESAVISSIVNDSGDIAYFIALKEDITEKKQMIADLINAKDKAEESDRLKSAFLANMSHEIRTPMNGILGFTDLLKEPNLSGEAQKEYINIIELSGARMLDTINNIVDISKIESGQMTVSKSEININEQIESIFSFFTPTFMQKGIRFSFKNSLPVNEANIITDHKKIHIILSNLVRNAIKFTEEGSVEIGYNRCTTVSDSELIFYVKDTGIGIPHENMNIIFERFRQGSESNSRNYEGAGLGLSISKAYVELLGGKIWAESRVGFGSTFYFSIPY